MTEREQALQEAAALARSIGQQYGPMPSWVAMLIARGIEALR